MLRGSALSTRYCRSANISNKHVKPVAQYRTKVAGPPRKISPTPGRHRSHLTFLVSMSPSTNSQWNPRTKQIPRSTRTWWNGCTSSLEYQRDRRRKEQSQMLIRLIGTTGIHSHVINEVRRHIHAEPSGLQAAVSRTKVMFIGSGTIQIEQLVVERYYAVSMVVNLE